MGIFDGAGIHGTEEIGSLGTRRLARLRPDGDPRRGRALRPGRRRHADLHRRKPQEARSPLRRTQAVGMEMRTRPGPGTRPCSAFDRALKARGMAEQTRRAYGVDLEQFADLGAAAWPRARRPGRHRDVRRYAAGCRRGAASKTTVARKLAAIRSLLPTTSSHRARSRPNPADLVASPKRDAYLPRVLKPGEVAALLERIPASTPLELRDRAMFELAYSAGLRCEEIVNLDLADLDSDGEELRVLGKGAKDAHPAGRASRPGARSSATSSAARAALAARSRVEPALFLSKTGRRLSTSDVRRRLSALGPQGGPGPAGLPSLPASLVCNPSARGRGRSAGDPGTARPFQSFQRPRSTLG